MSRRDLLYVSSAEQIARTKKSLGRIMAEEKPTFGASAPSFKVAHPSLGKLELHLTLVERIEDVASHLRHSPIDLLVYDERGHETMGTVEAISLIKEDVAKITTVLGPDFEFPTKRIVAILGQHHDTARQTFLLGRLHLRDIQVNPKHLGSSLKWIAGMMIEDSNQTDKVGVAFGGGGIEGFLFQLGCYHAINQAMSARKLDTAEVYSGVSSGSILASMGACKVDPTEVIRSLHGVSETLPRLGSSTLFDLAGTDIVSRFVSNLTSWPLGDSGKWLTSLASTLPTGFFNGHKLTDYIRDALSSHGEGDRFDDLDATLFVGATDQDTFEHKIFGLGEGPFPNISDAVRASCALPPFYKPKKIFRRNYIDGQITENCNLHEVIKQGCKLVIIVDTLKPYIYQEAGSSDKLGGVHSVIQVVKGLVHTRFRNSMEHLAERYPDVDFLLFQPDDESAHAMAGSPMKYKLRRELVELAFRGTLQKLQARYHLYSTKLGKHGFTMKTIAELNRMENHGLEF